MRPFTFGQAAQPGELSAVVRIDLNLFGVTFDYVGIGWGYLVIAHGSRNDSYRQI